MDSGLSTEAQYLYTTKRVNNAVHLGPASDKCDDIGLSPDQELISNQELICHRWSSLFWLVLAVLCCVSLGVWWNPRPDYFTFHLLSVKLPKKTLVLHVLYTPLYVGSAQYWMSEWMCKHWFGSCDLTPLLLLTPSMCDRIWPVFGSMALWQVAN